MPVNLDLFACGNIQKQAVSQSKENFEVDKV